ncbi:recombinase family protein [Fodinicola acaciae]|uniref:recombinase family protein n=1 Tax=Fodinicola acaciae TaxID=2681555 RepID=UPI0013CF52B7|nr:recombinase family protein [Fodinicola acaciae]
MTKVMNRHRPRRAVATELNSRGHRNTNGGKFNGVQVGRILNNRLYIGEIAFRETVTSNAHPAIVSIETWDRAQAILEERGENQSRRAASGSDYMLTCRMPCPDCGAAMIGTSAHGRSRRYRYYTCWNTSQFGSSKCNAKRLDADSVDDAVTQALADFYRHQHELINDGVEAARANYYAATDNLHAELKTVEAELSKNRHDHRPVSRRVRTRDHDRGDRRPTPASTPRQDQRATPTSRSTHVRP